MQYSKQEVIEILRRGGLAKLADEAALELPDPVDFHRLDEWCFQHGITRDQMISRFGGSP